MRREFSIGPDDDGFTRDADLYDSGYVDSIGVTELISLLESTFSIEIPEEDLFSDAFTTINGVSRIVCRCANERNGANGNGAGTSGAEDWPSADDKQRAVG